MNKGELLRKYLDDMMHDFPINLEFSYGTRPNSSGIGIIAYKEGYVPETHVWHTDVLKRIFERILKMTATK